MKVLFKYCKQGNGEFNEDAILTTSKLSCVIDGATDVYLDEHPQLRGIVNEYVNEIIESLDEMNKEEMTLKDIVKTSLINTYHKLNSKYDLDAYMEYELPTFSIACIKENKNEYEYLVLGDCFLVFSIQEHIQMIEDRRIRIFSKHNRDEMKGLNLDPRCNKESLEVYKNTRKKANSNSGYPIGSVSGTGIDEAICGTVKKDNVNGILLFSDGFIDYFNSIKIEYKELFDEKYLSNIIKQSDMYYSDNEMYMEQLRPKQCDDRSIIMMKSGEI